MQSPAHSRRVVHLPSPVALLIWTTLTVAMDDECRSPPLLSGGSAALSRPEEEVDPTRIILATANNRYQGPAQTTRNRTYPDFIAKGSLIAQGGGSERSVSAPAGSGLSRAPPPSLRRQNIAASSMFLYTCTSTTASRILNLNLQVPQYSRVIA